MTPLISHAIALILGFLFGLLVAVGAVIFLEWLAEEEAKEIEAERQREAAYRRTHTAHGTPRHVIEEEC